RGAKISAEWKDAPSRADIRKNDAERLIEMLRQPVEIDEDDRELATRLMSEKTPEDIAAMLVQSHRAKMPAPEQMLDRGAQSKPAPGGPRPGFEDTVWFKMDVGHNQRADARWILPVLCRRGHITKNEIGAIRINGNDTLFEIPRVVEAKFTKAVAQKRDGGDDTDDITITRFEGTPRDAAKRNRKGRRDNAGGGRDYSNASKKFGGKKFGKRKRAEGKAGGKSFDGKPGAKRKFASDGNHDGGGPGKPAESGDRKKEPKGPFGGKKKKPHRGKRPFEGKPRRD
ncbi:MAG: DbpA RNA binding domain-containing protein, partial [Pseudomonadota bacterium]